MSQRLITVDEIDDAFAMAIGAAGMGDPKSPVAAGAMAVALKRAQDTIKRAQDTIEYLQSQLVLERRRRRAAENRLKNAETQ